MLAVASSRITTLVFLNTALTIQTSYFSPALKLPPSSVIYYSIDLFKPASFNRDSIRAGSAVPAGSQLNRRLASNRTGSYYITVILSLSFYKGTVAISTPSIRIYPPESSTILVSAKPMVDFPAPVRPTMPTLHPAVTLRFN